MYITWTGSSPCSEVLTRSRQPRHVATTWSMAEEVTIMLLYWCCLSLRVLFDSSVRVTLCFRFRIHFYASLCEGGGVGGCRCRMWWRMFVSTCNSWLELNGKGCHKSNSYSKPTGWVKKNWDLKKFQIALTDSILKLKSIVITLNQMSQSGEKHAQD